MKNNVTLKTRLYTKVAKRLLPTAKIVGAAQADSLYADRPDRVIGPKESHAQIYERIRAESIRRELGARIARRSSALAALAVVPLALLLLVSAAVIDVTAVKVAEFRQERAIAAQREEQARRAEQARLEQQRQAQAAEEARRKTEAAAAELVPQTVKRYSQMWRKYPQEHIDAALYVMVKHEAQTSAAHLNSAARSLAVAGALDAGGTLPAGLDAPALPDRLADRQITQIERDLESRGELQARIAEYSRKITDAPADQLAKILAEKEAKLTKNTDTLAEIQAIKIVLGGK